MSLTINVLPDELLAYMFQYLPIEERMKARTVCQRFKQVIDENWEYILALNKEIPLPPTFKPSIKTSFSPSDFDYYWVKEKHPNLSLNEYTAWKRIDKIYYAIREKSIYRGSNFPLEILMETCSKSNLAWIGVSNRFIGTINDENVVHIYSRSSLRHLKTYNVMPYKFAHLSDNYFCAIASDGNYLCKANLNGNIEQNRHILLEGFRFTAHDNLILASRGTENYGYNLDTNRLSIVYPDKTIMNFDDGDLLFDMDGETYRMVRKGPLMSGCLDYGGFIVGLPLIALGLVCFTFGMVISRQYPIVGPVVTVCSGVILGFGVIALVAGGFRIHYNLRKRRFYRQLEV